MESLHPPATIDVEDDWSVPSNRSEISSPPNTPLSQKIFYEEEENYPAKTGTVPDIPLIPSIKEEEPGYIPKKTTIIEEEDPGHIPSPTGPPRKQNAALTPGTVDLTRDEIMEKPGYATDIPSDYYPTDEEPRRKREPRKVAPRQTDESDYSPPTRKAGSVDPLSSILTGTATAIQSTYENIDRLMLQPMYEEDAPGSPPSMVRIPRIRSSDEEDPNKEPEATITRTRSEDGPGDKKWWLENEINRRVQLAQDEVEEKKEEEIKPSYSEDEIDAPLRPKKLAQSLPPKLDYPNLEPALTDESDIDRPIRSKAKAPRQTQSLTIPRTTPSIATAPSSDMEPPSLSKGREANDIPMIKPRNGGEGGLPSLRMAQRTEKKKDKVAEVAESISHLSHLLKKDGSPTTSRKTRDPPTRDEPMSRESAIEIRRDQSPERAVRSRKTSEDTNSSIPRVVQKSVESFDSHSQVTTSDIGSSAKMIEPAGLAEDLLVPTTSLDKEIGIAKGDGMISLLVETSDMTWAGRVHEAIWRCRVVRQNSDSKWTSANIQRKLGVAPVGRPSTIVDLDDGKIAGGVAAYESAAHEFLRFDDLDNALAMYEDIIRNYYDMFELIQSQKDTKSRKTISKLRNYIGTALHNLGVVHLLRGEHKEAFNYFERAGTNRKACKGDTHADYLASLSRCALCRIAVEDFVGAKNDYEAVLQVIQPKANSMADFRICAEIYNNLGVLASSAGKADKAVKLLHEAIKMHISVSEQSLYNGSKSAGYTASLNQSISKGNVGYVALISKKIPVAIQSFEFALREQQVLLRDAHSTLIATMDHLAVAQLVAGSKSKAEQLLRKMLNLQTEAYGPDNWRSKTTSDRIAKLADEDKPSTKSKSLFKKKKAKQQD